MGRVLVIRGGALGDFLLTVPAIHLLREGLSGNEIELLGYEPAITLARETGLVDFARPIEYGPLATFFVRPDRSDLPKDLVEYFAGFDLVVSYLYDPDGHFEENLEKAGVETLIACSHQMDLAGAHASRQLAAPLEQIALFLPDELKLTLGDTCGTEAGDRAARIAIHPGSGGETKNWPVSHWLEVAGTLKADFPTYELLLVTGEVEDARGQTAEFVSAAEARGIEFRHADSLPITELFHELRNCSHFLGHDSGVAHLAAAADTPSLLLFGPTDPEIWSPATQRSQVLKAPDGELSALSVDEVIASVRAQIF